MKRASGATATRVAFAGAIAAALAMSACRVNTATTATSSATAGVDRQTSALTALSRTGWVLSTCTTASVCGGTLANAIDGNASTAWTTAANQATTQFFKVDTLTAHSVVGIGLDAGTSVNDFPHTYSVAVSTNDSAYTTVATGTGTTPLVNVAFGAQTARYIKISITAAASVPWSIAELNVYATALSRTGWALSASPTGTNIANAIDGSATTKWTSGVNQASGQFFQIDMLNLKSINQITLDAGTSTGEFPHALQVLVSKDGLSTTFTNVVTTATGSSQLVTLSFPSVEARFLRVSLTGAASSFWSIFEINVFGSTTPATALPRTGWATAAGTKSSPAPGGGTTLANAFDGSASTRWATGAGQAVGNFFQVDMLGPQSFNQLTLDAGTTPSDYPRGFQVFVSNDGTNFGSAIASGNGTSALVTVTFPLQNARYIKITLTQAFAANWWSIAELNVYGPAFARNGWVATSSTALSGTNYQSNAIDGSASTRWTTGANQANGQTFQLDMAVPETFTGLTVDAGTSTGQYPRGYQVFVSNDGTTWGSAIATGSGTTELLTIAFPIHTARYLKIVQTGSAATPWAIQELNVWRACGSNTCATSDQCHNVGVCDPVLLACSNPAKSDGASCNDGNACTTGETCQSGTCANGTTVTCTTDQCHTVAACVPATGCPAPVAKANGSTCSDGNACTQTDTCQSGVCTGGNPVTCVASDQCHVVGTCNASTGVCTNPSAANGAACSDGNACTRTDTCQSGVCTGGNPVTCVASDQCHVAGTCNTSTGVCTNPSAVNGAACSDGNACTRTDTCQSGVCTGGNPVTCVASDQCHVAGTCNTGTGVCTNPSAANGAACSDGNACTRTDTCQSGVCTGGNPVTCVASDQCHVAGTCNTGTGVCTNPLVADGTTCSDGNACTQTDACQAGVCTGGNPVTCVASDQCHVAGTCNTATGTCTNPTVADGTACSDGNACTQTDTCSNGVCRGQSVTCTAQDQCHLAGTCNPTTGTCGSPEQLNGTTCDDGNTSTQGETCELGSCRAPTSYTQPTFLPIDDLGTLGGITSIAQGMNDAGDVVGNSTRADGLNHAFVWMTPGPMQDLGAQPGFPVTSVGVGINDSGTIVGTLTESSGSHHAFVDDGTLQDLGPGGDDQPDSLGDRGSYTSAINASGQIAGSFTNGGDVHGYRYSMATSFQDIGSLAGRQTLADGISDAGVIVGSSWVTGTPTSGGIRALGHAFVTNDVLGELVDLNTYVDPASGWTLINGKAISPNGTYIVGSGDRAGLLRGYRLNTTTGIVDEISSGWSSDVFPNAVNDQGDVVGTGFPDASTPLTGWIYTDASGFRKINDLLPAASGWNIQVVSAIDAAGDVTGWGTIQGQDRAFRLRKGLSCPAACTASDQCHLAGTCNPTTGTCSNPAKLNGTTCDDGNPATQGDVCELGVCRAPSSYVQVSNIQIDDLGDLGGGSSSAFGINNLSTVTGNSSRVDGQSDVFVWAPPGPMTDFAANQAFPPGSVASDINDSGTVAGTIYEQGGRHAFRYGVEGFEDLGVGGDNSTALDYFQYQGAYAEWMNASGQLAGLYTNNEVISGFRYTDGPGFEDIGSLAGGETIAWGLSDSGTVVGSSWVPGSPHVTSERRLGHAVMWDEVTRKLVDLNQFVDPTMMWTLAIATSISPNGRYIVGDGDRDGVLRTFRLDTATGNLDEVSGGFAGDSYSNRVNDSGDVVGTGLIDAANTVRGAWLYTDEIGFKKLNDLIDPASGWNLTFAEAINDNGEIVGVGSHQGHNHAFRLHRIVTPQLACVGKQDGDTCDSGNTCGAHNVCSGGVCGGNAPADAVCLSADGVVDIGNGQFVAVFGFSNQGSGTIIPTIDQVLLDGTVVVDPDPAPPPWLPTGIHPGVFLPRFASGHTVSWRVNGQQVTASVEASPNLPRVAIGTSGYGVEIGGTLVTIQADLAPYGTPPAEVGPPCSSATDCSANTPVCSSAGTCVQAEPAVGAQFNGVLTGKLGVNSSGAATYTVPISIPPGIAGMAPNLNLVYSSQGGNGIAGQGWELTGLSSIYRCPKTLVQDGVTVPVTAGAFNNNKTGVCLDGKRLFQQDGTTYKSEQQDFSTITMSADGQTFTVVTKAGETRYYGRDPGARVSLPVAEIEPAGENDIVLWALDRVMDNWGNYYDITYNRSGEEVALEGLRVTRIDYTKHARSTSDTGSADTPAFSYVTFAYEISQGQGDAARPDIRTVRFGQVTLPKKYRLSQIATPAGTYALGYLPDNDPMLPSRLRSITYCGPTQCLTPLQFEWQGGGYGWDNVKGPNQIAGAYDLPVFIGPEEPGQYRGTRLVDLNGDGLPDLVQAQAQEAPDTTASEHVWRNSGSGWVPQDSWILPANLADVNFAPTGTLLVDVDGDGKPDVVSDSPSSGLSSPKIWLNKINIANTQQTSWPPNPGNWQLPSDWGAVHFLPNPSNSEAPVDTMVDMNGDGRADLVRTTPPQCTDPGHGFIPVCTNGDIAVLLNTPAGWQPASQYSFAGSGLAGKSTDYRLEDANRDGFPDLVGTSTVALNTVTPRENGSAWESTTGNYDTFFSAGKGHRIRGDIDGDGLYDVLETTPVLADPNACANESASVSYNVVPPQVTFSTGHGFDGTSLAPFLYASSAAPFLPSACPNGSNCVSCNSASGTLAGSFLFNLADLNGDGLADLVLSHPVAGVPVPDLWSKGQLFVNTGTSWKDLNEAINFNNFANPANAVPTAPTTDSKWSAGAVFVDLNGDGLVDVTGTDSGQQSYLNTFTPPMITMFPAGLAQPTQVSYASITTSHALSDLVGPTQTPIYSDTNDLAPGTRYAAIPIRVVSTVNAEDRTNIGAMVQTDYHYQSFRVDAAGRGPLGFMLMTVVDGASQVKTTSRFAQAYPYTGMVTGVTRTSFAPNAAHPVISQTATTYCDSSLPDGATPTCTPMTGVLSGSYPINTSTFVYAQSILDRAFSWKNQLASGSSGYAFAQTVSTFSYDDAGNPIQTAVSMSGMIGDSYSKTTVNTYGTPGSRERLLGKVTQAIVTSTGPNGSIVHTTAFDYADVNTYYPDSSGSSQSSFALVKTRIEPNSPQQGVEEHTAYAYDRYGNVITTTSCASDFGQCSPGAVNNSDIGNYLSPPFRTTTVSYTTSAFNFPPGVGLSSGLPYGDGRFPVRTTDAAGHAEYAAYDPMKGVLVEKTDANGINECHAYDDFGRVVTDTARCGTANLSTTYERFLTTNADPYPAKVVTRTRPPVGGATWLYADAFGQKIAVVGRSFDGGFAESMTNYDSLGRIAGHSKPFIVGRGPLYQTVPTYDPLGRPSQVSQDLGAIDGVNLNTVSVVSTTFDGSTVTTQESVNGQNQTRAVTKNALGKEWLIVDAYQKAIRYGYDADGNLTDTYDSVNIDGSFADPPDIGKNNVHIVYDLRGRKVSSADPDLGQWIYVYNGFGDLIIQIDGQAQTTIMTYDQLGRMISKLDSTGAAFWVYDQGQGGVGKLSAMIGAPSDHLNGSCAIPFTDSVAYVNLAQGGNRAVKTYSYTSFGQPQTTQECTDGDTFVTSYDYDQFGRQNQLTYPAIDGTRLSVAYHYTTLGFLQYISDVSDGMIYWAATAMNAAGQVTDELTRNGVRTQSIRDDATGWLLGSSSYAQADGNRLIQNWSYQFDEVGNLLWRGRSDSVNTSPAEETFSYDLLNRLNTSAVAIPAQSYNQGDGFSYDEVGNILAKSGVGYTYTGCAAGARVAGPHAVCSVGAVQYSYDGNGNMTSSTAGRFVNYNPANKPIEIGDGDARVHFAYGADGNRVVQDVGSASNASASVRTVYVGLGATGKSIYERTTNGGSVQHVQFLYAGGTHGGNAFAVRTVTDDASGSNPASMNYYHYDHLGSVTAMSDERGHVVDATWGGPDAGVMSYTPWGERRNPDGSAADPASFNPPVGHRSFTGQESIPGVSLINMNGRVYDPALGRFLTPDPNVQFSADLQSYNRYSYALNNPLRYTDPTGYFSVFDGAVFAIETLVAVAAIYACGPTGGATCAIAVAIFSASLSAVDMAANGASWQQIAITSAVSLGAGYFGGIVGGAATGDSLMGSMVGGAVAGATSSIIASAFTGQGLSVTNILEGAAMGAAMGALAYEHSTAVSQASTNGGGTQEANTETAAIKEDQTEKQGMVHQMRDALLDYIKTTTNDFVDDFETGLEEYYDEQNAAARQGIADTALDLSRDGGGQFGTNNEYDGKNFTVGAGKYKCNIYVHDVLDAAGIPNRMMVANTWGNPNADIPGWVQVDYEDAEPGDVAAFARSGGHHGHVGIIIASGPPSALAASDEGVISTGTFSASHPHASAPVVWRWTGL